MGRPPALLASCVNQFRIGYAVWGSDRCDAYHAAMFIVVNLPDELCNSPISRILSETSSWGASLAAVHSEIDIAAGPARVWELLSQLDGYASWNPSIAGLR